MGRSLFIRVLVGVFILFPVTRTLAAHGNCQTNITSIQHDALVSLYNISGGENWTNNTGWLQNIECKSSNVILPNYCCWAGVRCCLSADNETEDYDASLCAQYQCNCHVGAVIGLALGRNNLRGALLQDILSGQFLDAMSCSLRVFFLGGNGLSGTIPGDIRTLADLRIVSFSSNNLTGSIPGSFAYMPLLEELDMANNMLTGSVPPALCGFAQRVSNLRDLVLSNNNLTGNLSLPSCESLIYLDVQNNNFQGGFPNLSSYRQLHILRLGNNNFSGPVSINRFTLRLLVMLDLSLNSFSGPLPDFVGQSSQLTLVRVFNNSFTGTISPDIFTVGTLGTFAASNNLIKGTLPESIGSARGISSISFRGNFIYGTLPESLGNLGYNGGTVDVSLTNMSCCGYDFDVENTTGYRHFNLSAPRLPSFLTLSDQSRPVFDTGLNLAYMRCPFVIVKPEYTYNQSDTFLTWAVDPQYFLYEGCTCLEGYNAAWANPPDGVYSMGPALTCVRALNPWYIRYPWAVVLIVLGGLLVASWLTYLMCFRRGKNAAIVQSVLNMRKRIKGEPIGGQVSIVVTDIEGYSDLMKQSPQLMTRALNLHNAIVRKSRWNNFGYTLEQEGDSYALVFYDAQDAVIFCLQTQLALNKQAWPEGLFGADARDAVAKRRQQAPSLLNAISVMTNNLTHSLFGGRSAIPGQAGEGSSAAMAAGSGALGTRGTSMDCRVDSCQTRFGVESNSTLAPGVAALHPESSSMAPALSTAAKGHPVLFNGLRVRMGIATGQLPPGTSSKGSAVMDMAKVVSDAANGGQIMLDETTFKNVKERIEEFGAVDHNGMNFKRLNAIKPPWYSCMNRKAHRNSEDALLLDMGEYTHCPGCKRLPLFQLEATPGADTPGGSSGGAPPVTPKGRRGKGGELMRLYQVVPPALVSRAKVFGNKITIKDEWYCSDDPYFAAPGTLDAPLGVVDGPLALPPITMAFAIVEGGKTFAARHRRDVRRVNDVCAACIRACLRVVAGGYLCRLQDGDLKYMVAFATPQAAVEWALLLQDVLMYADWPEAALKYWREEYDDRGRMLFRGPRMKIGLCEGSPRSIIPDHIGRADYHGASVNQAARYMDAAAHGGMIAVEATLVVKVMDAWRAAAAAAEAAAVAAAATAEAAAAAERCSASTAASAFAVAGASAAAVAAAAAAAGGASGSSGSVKVGHPLGGGSLVEAARSVGSMNAPAPSRGGSRKGRMAAVQEADAAEEHPNPSQSAAAPPPPQQLALPASGAHAKGRGNGVGGGRRSGGSEPTMMLGARAAPVSEAIEHDSAEADPAAASAAAAAGAVGELQNGNNVGAVSAAVAAAPLESEPSVEGLPGHRLSYRHAAESGPSMTSLASSHTVAALATGSSTLATTPMARQDSTSDGEALAAAAAAGAALVAAAKLPDGAVTGGFGVSQRPAPLALEPSAADVGARSPNPFATHPHPGAEIAADTPNAPPPPHPAAAVLRVQIPASSPPVNSPSLPPRPRPPPGAAAAAASAHSAVRGPGTVPRTHVSFATGGDHGGPSLASHPIVTSGDSALLSPIDQAGQRSTSSAASGPPSGPTAAAAAAASTPAHLRPAPSASAAAAAAAPPPPPPGAFTAAAVAAVALSGRRPHGGSVPGSLSEFTPAASVASVASVTSAATPLSPAPSSSRSPRPPALTPLALPTEREREEVLRTERAAAEASRRVSVDGPADARYKAHVQAYRIGVFRFKGNPEPIQMAHVVLEHLAARRFPSDAPKGKGAKVGDASGLLDECDTTLPDLAALMRDRYMLINGSAQRAYGFGAAAVLDGNRSSPSNRRLHTLMTSSSMGANAVQHGGYSPRVVVGGGSPLRSGAGAGVMPKSRSMAARLGGGGGGSGSTLSHDGGGESPGSGSGGPTGPPPPPSGGTPRRGGGQHLMSQLANFATASLRRTVGKGHAGSGADQQRDDGDAAAASAAGAEQGFELEMGRPQVREEAAAGQGRRRSGDASAPAAAVAAVAVDVGSLEPTISVALVAQDDDAEDGGAAGHAAAVSPPPPPPQLAAAALAVTPAAAAPPVNASSSWTAGFAAAAAVGATGAGAGGSGPRAADPGAPRGDEHV